QARYVIAAKPFSEQYVLAALIEQRLAAQGLSSVRRDGLGSGVIFNALAAGDIDAYVDYSGTILTNQMKRSDVKTRAQVLTEVARWLETTHGIRLLGPLGFENAYALAMPRARAEALGIKSIADLAAHAPQLSIAGDYEFFERPEWKAIRDAYGLRFRQQRTMQPDFMYRPHAPATSTWCRPIPATAASRSSISPCSATPSRPSRLMTPSCWSRPSARRTRP